MKREYSFTICPECGGKMKRSSKKCAICSTTKTGKGICPRCNGPKTKRSKLCRKCHLGADTREAFIPNRPWWWPPAQIDAPEDFMRAFAGLFMGEGYVGHATNRRAIRIGITLRDDDSEVLRLAQQYLGGKCRSIRGGRIGDRPRTYWHLQRLPDVLFVLNAIAEYAAPLRCKKLRDVQIAIEYGEWRLSQPYHLSPEGQIVADDFCQRLSDVKLYNSR